MVSKEGRSVAAALDKRVRIFDADTFKQVVETPEAPDWVNNALSFSADGRWLATSGNDRTARIWQVSVHIVLAGSGDWMLGASVSAWFASFDP